MENGRLPNIKLSIIFFLNFKPVYEALLVNRSSGMQQQSKMNSRQNQNSLHPVPIPIFESFAGGKKNTDVSFSWGVCFI